MTESPDILILHTIGVRRFDNGEDLYDAVNERFEGNRVVLSKNSEQTDDLLREAEIILASRFPPELFERAPNLQWVQALSSGIDFYDIGEFEKNDVILTNVAGVHSEPIAEHVLGYMLAFERDFLRSFENKRNSVWERYQGGELNSKTVGIIGVGAVGTRVAELSKEFGMEVLGVKRTMEPVRSVDELFEAGNIWPVIERSDYVLLSCPLTDQTEGLIGAEELKAMKNTSVLINIARGEVVDESVLVETLQQRGIRGAALDVFREEPLPESSPLWDLPNVIVTPHVAGSSPHKHDRIVEIFEENYERYMEGDIDSMLNRII